MDRSTRRAGCVWTSRSGPSMAAIVAWNSSPERAESRLIRLIAGIDEEFGQMPPKGKGTLLTADDVGIVRAWIDQGAVWPDEQQLATAAADHWSLKPVRGPALPVVREAAWPKEAVDSFVIARLEQEQVRHSPAAEKTTLLRRLFLDLIGLP